MQRLEVSCALQLIYTSLGAKGLMCPSQLVSAHHKCHHQAVFVAVIMVRCTTGSAVCSVLQIFGAHAERTIKISAIRNMTACSLVVLQHAERRNIPQDRHNPRKVQGLP